MDVVICLQRLLRCYLLLLPKVVNKDGESQVKKKKNPCVTALETLPHPQTDLIRHHLTFPLFSFSQVIPFCCAHGKRNAAQFCELN